MSNQVQKKSKRIILKTKTEPVAVKNIHVLLMCDLGAVK